MRSALRLGSIVWFPIGIVVALMVVVSVEAGSADESTLPSLEFSQFGDPAESPYCLPYPEGDSYPVNNTYSTPGSHVGRFAYDTPRS